VKHLAPTLRSVRVVNEKERERRGRGAEVEGRTREDRSAEGVGMGRGCPPPYRGKGTREQACPSREKKIDFGSQYGQFWCILDGIFLQFSYLF